MRYIVSALSPRSHLIDVELHLDDAGTDPIRIAFPTWVPGHYLIEDFAGQVRGEKATGDNGKPLPMRKLDKTTWEIRQGRSRSVRFAFSTWAYEVSVHRSFLDDQRMSINGGHVFPYVIGRESQPCEVEFRLPPEWSGPYTGLEPVAGQPSLFTAQDYDELLDCPVLAGHPAIRSFKLQGVPHYLVISGTNNAPLQYLVKDIEKLSKTAAALFGKLPYKHFHYLVDTAQTRGGGLEHRNSTHCILGRWSFHPRAAYVDSLGLFSHEFFHTWNVKRLRPAKLGPFDYTKEVQTPLLWFAEGCTSYYEMIVLRRAGVITPREFLDLLGRQIQRLDLVPGRRCQTLEASSEETWIKFYKKGPHALNSQISYYNKGCLVGFLLDLELRLRTRNKRSMDDLMRRMYDEYHGRLNRGFTPEELEEEASQLAGMSLAAFFERCLRSTQELDTKRALAAAGLEAAVLEAAVPKGEVLPRTSTAPLSYLGIGLKLGESLVIESVLEDGPAAAGGLTPGDEILAINGHRLNPGRMEGLLAENPPGMPLSVLVDRYGEIREFGVVLGARPGVAISIRPKMKASPLEKQVCRAWSNAEWSAIDRTSPPVAQRERDRVD